MRAAGRARRLAVGALLVTLAGAPGARAAEGAAEARPAGGAGSDAGAAQTSAPPPVAFFDAAGRPERATFEALVSEIERARGLAFVRRPELVSVPADSPERRALAEQARAREPLGADVVPERAADLAAVEADLANARVVVSGPATAPGPPGSSGPAGTPDRFALGLALARILDAQHYPRLAEAAPRVGGDAGVALRSLLRASTSLTVTRSWRAGSGPAPDPAELDLLRRPRLAGRIGSVPQFAPTSAWVVAALFLALREDREEAFRVPPLSTKQILSPPAYDASDRPLRLAGPAPEVSGCTLRRDESLGVLAMLVALTQNDGAVAGAALADWKGDRLLRFACADGAAPWIYVARLARADEAQGFASALDVLLPPELERPFGSAREGARIVAWSGLPGGPIRDFADGLEEIELRDLAQLAP